MPGRSLPGRERPAAVPLPPVHLRRGTRLPPGVRPGDPLAAPTPPDAGRRRLPHGQRGLLQPHRPRLLEPAALMAAPKAPLTARMVRWLDRRVGGARMARKTLD